MSRVFVDGSAISVLTSGLEEVKEKLSNDVLRAGLMVKRAEINNGDLSLKLEEAEYALKKAENEKKATLEAQKGKIEKAVERSVVAIEEAKELFDKTERIVGVLTKIAERGGADTLLDIIDSLSE